MRDKQKGRRERTWAEAARMVLENYSDAPMTPKQILNVIEAEGLKETRYVGSSPLACLNTMLHSNSRTREALFYKLPGRISLFTMKKNATQWSRVVSLPEDGDMEDTADEEGGQWMEGSSGTPVETCNASCSGEYRGRETRSLVQMNKQKRRSGVLLPRVVLTPLKVNGAHLPSTSGSSAGREGQSSSSRNLGGNLNLHRRAALSRDNPHHLRGIRSTTSGQVKKNKAEEIDFETPGSILVNTNLRALINVRTFNALPHSLQQQLLLLLPDVDRQVTPEGPMRMSGSALNNEFFAHACQRWRERLAEGEFTPEAQLRMRQEMDKEKKVEDWKETFFEDFYGQKCGLSVESLSDNDDKCVTPVSKSPLRGGQKKNTATTPKETLIPEARIRTRSVFKKEIKEERVEQTAKVDDFKANSSPVTESKEPEIPTLEAHIPPKDEGNLPSTSERVPELHPETSEHKRKNCEPESSSPSLEKKPRMEQRQSFRNTIQSVYTEKPQPTKEEPKVPPIRIQLSRIKPPWLDKGLPAYQICPRIIPNTGPIGCWTNPCTPADCQTSGSQFTTSIGGGGGPGGGGSIDKRRTWSTNPKRRRSSKRRQRRQSPNCCRTQLLSSSYLRKNLQKPAVPPVRISWTSCVRNTYSGTDGFGAAKEAVCNSVVEAKLNDTKDTCTAEAAISSTIIDGVQGYRVMDNVQPLNSQMTLEGDLDIQSEAGAQCNKQNNVQFGLIYKKETTSSDCTAAEPVAENVSQSSVESLTPVLGDVSNTFQNKLKPVETKEKIRDPLDCKSDFVVTAEQLQNGSPESHQLSSADLQTALTSLPGHSVEMYPGSTDLSMDWTNEPFEASSRPQSGDQILQKSNHRKAEPEAVPSQPDVTTHPTLETYIKSLSKAVKEEIADHKIDVQDLRLLTETSEAGSLIKLGLSDNSDCPTGDLSEQNHLPTSDVVFSPRLTNDENLLSRFEPSLDSSLFEANDRGFSSSTDPFEGVKQDSTDSKPLAGPMLSTSEEFPSSNQNSKSFRKPKQRLCNKASFIRNLHRVPLLLDLPFMRFSKAERPDAQLPIELSAQPMHKKTKRSPLGKVFKGPQDLASCLYSTDVQPPGLLGKYAVSGQASFSMQVIADCNGNEKISLWCSCSLKAMSSCKGCGAFCHNDCIGPSKLCVSCLVIR
ncbi:polycomb group protein ASXL1 isoform X3 [Pelobates fuscus]|uniref:polycomb group protein ASXL1 isoform X3 n=1 Tax=Pelobates fuscus TaxID=191477 RepID=UPI002FE4B92E